MELRKQKLFSRNKKESISHKNFIMTNDEIEYVKQKINYLYNGTKEKLKEYQVHFDFQDGYVTGLLKIDFSNDLFNAFSIDRNVHHVMDLLIEDIKNRQQL